MRVIISGGGTGGHIFPAIAIADAIRKMDAAVEILFVGAEGKMEMERVPRAGYRIVGLPVVGFQRQMNFKNLKNNLFFPFKLISSLLKAHKIISDFRPDVVVGVGGYASGPVLRVAMAMGVPGLIQEQNSFAGVTNKILARKASVICVAYDRMERFFPKDKIFNLGNPVREDILRQNLSVGDARRFYGLDPIKRTIVLIGGSLGARSLNEAVLQSGALLRDREDVQLLWQCGKLYHEELMRSEIAGMKNVKLTAFLERMDYAYTAADVVISRAGALSISEICLVSKPVVLVPSPNVAEDHQTSNAMALVNENAAVLVKDNNAAVEMMPEALALLDNPDRMNKLRDHIALLAKPDAASDIARMVLKIARRENL